MYQGEQDIEETDFFPNGVWNNSTHARKQSQEEVQIKFYKVMAIPMLLYGNETWTMNKKDATKIQSAEVKFLRSVKGCT